MEQNTIKLKFPSVSIKNGLRLLSLLCLVFVFCPSFLVSCSGEVKEVDVITAIQGVSSYGEEIVEPHPAMLICILIPIAMFIYLLLKEYDEQQLASRLLVLSIIDIVMWLKFKSTTEKLAEENYFEFETTKWFYANLVTLSLIILLSILVFFEVVPLVQAEVSNARSINLTNITLPKIQINSGTQTPAKVASVPIQNKYIFCSRCGMKNFSSSNFCTNCGSVLQTADDVAPTVVDVTPSVNEAEAPVTTEAPVTAEAVATNEVPASDVVSAAKEVNVSSEVIAVSKTPLYIELIGKFKNLSKTIKTIILVAIVAVIIAIFAIVKSASTINLNKYVKVETTGYDGHGKAYVSVDWDSLEEKYGDKLTYSDKTVGYAGFYGPMSPMYALQDMVYIDVDKANNLSNGEKVKYSWDMDAELSYSFNMKIKYKDSSFKVSGLNPIEYFDPFENLEVSYYGVSPDAYVDISYNGSEFSDYDFDIDTSANGVRNGAPLYISIYESAANDCAEYYGKYPLSLSKEYIPDSLDAYAGTFDDISDFYTDFVNMAKANVEYELAYYYDNPVYLTNLTSIGHIMRTPKSRDNYDYPGNYFYVVLKADVLIPEINFEYTYYFPYRFQEIITSGEKNKVLSGYTLYGIESGYNYMGNYYFRGYSDLDNLYYDLVTSYEDEYSIESDIF